MPKLTGPRLEELTDDELAAVMPLLEDVRLSVARLSPADRALYDDAQRSAAVAKRLASVRVAPPPLTR
jgi:hypothetical protein